MIRKIGISLVLLISAVTTIANTDDEASNVPMVFVSQWNRCYAKSVPTERYGSKGTTTVFSVSASKDMPGHTFPWYSNRIYLECAVAREGLGTALSVVQFGPLGRGRKASAEDLAIAFHYGEKLVKQYSTLQIAGSSTNVGNSISHYWVIDCVDGYRTKKNNPTTFEVISTDGRLLVFDPTTGELLSAGKNAPAANACRARLN